MESTQTSPAQFDRLVQALGIEQIPDSWPERWEQFQSAGACPAARFEVSDNASDLLDLPGEALDVLSQACSVVRKDPELTELGRFWHHMIHHAPVRPVDCREWPNPDARMGQLAAMFPLVALVSCFGHAMQTFGNMDVPDEVIRDTMSDVGMWTRNYRKSNGRWGFGELIWLVRHVRGEIFRLGRLQFALNTYCWPWRVYRNRVTGEVLALCESGVRYGADGLVLEPGDTPDPSSTWVSELEITPESVTGSSVRAADGVASRERVTLSTSEWDGIIAPGDDSLEVHIPGGSKMDHDACTESFRRALDFFPRRFPEKRFATFTCYSWLCDPALALIMPEDTNLSRFQRRFYVLPREGKQKQTADRVFGSDSIDPCNAPRLTSLQRAIADYVASGGVMRCAAGIIPWER